MAQRKPWEQHEHFHRLAHQRIGRRKQFASVVREQIDGPLAPNLISAGKRPPSPRQHESRSFVTANGSFIPIIALFPIYNSTQTVRGETQAPLSTLRASPPTKLTQTPTREKEPRQRGSFWKQSLCSRTLYTLNLKCMTSPSCTTYSLPSWRSLPALRQPNSPPSST